METFRWQQESEIQGTVSQSCLRACLQFWLRRRDEPDPGIIWDKRRNSRRLGKQSEMDSPQTKRQERWMEKITGLGLC